ncbi:MAG TPA: hypothetical protein VEW95_09385 [Candidatus Limnocylindrales bacterium]|nr:hypothetical protein [Candidatus Limnocylindrales bacterium]
MSHCSNCGQLADGSFCRNCGASLQQQPTSSLQATVRGDVATGLMAIAFIGGFFAGGALWLWLLYDESVTAQSMVWFLGALPAAIVGAFLAKWGVVALLTK